MAQRVLYLAPRDVRAYRPAPTVIHQCTPACMPTCIIYSMTHHIPVNRKASFFFWTDRSSGQQVTTPISSWRCMHVRAVHQRIVNLMTLLCSEKCQQINLKPQKKHKRNPCFHERGRLCRRSVFDRTVPAKRGKLQSGYSQADIVTHLQFV